MSQAQFASIFELTRGTIGAYEEERAEPKVDTIIQIANYFGLSVDLLLSKELTVNELFSLDIVKEKLDQAHHFGEKPAKTFRKGGIGLVRINQYLEYIINRTNRDFLAALPYIELPVQSRKVSRAFELSGSEMEYQQNGLHHGDILLASNTGLKLILLELEKVYVIVLNEGIQVRRLKSMEGNKLGFMADDPNYSPSEFEPKDIVELWEVVGAYSAYLHAPKMLDERVMLLENKMRELAGVVQELKGKTS